MRGDAPRSRSPPGLDVAGLLRSAARNCACSPSGHPIGADHDPIACRDHQVVSLRLVMARPVETGVLRRGHVMVKRRSLRKPLLTLLVLLIALAGVQFGPGANSASAGEVQNCPPFAIMKKPAPGTNFDAEYRCLEFLSFDGSTKVWGWFTSGVKPKRRDEKTVWVGGRTSPPYTMVLQGLVSDSRPGGAAGGSVIITTPSGGNLDRRIAVMVRMQYYRPSTGWGTCSNTNWKEAASPRSWMEWFIDQGTVPNCGNGSYRAQVYGRFFSVSLNRWEQRGPIYSPSIPLPPPV